MFIDYNQIDPFIFIILSSPSGTGKTTLCNRLREEFTQFRFSISHTTRNPRHSEINGREYHFVSHEQFQTMVQTNQFAEWAVVHGNYYGTSFYEIEAARKNSNGIIFDIDFQGARQLKTSFHDAIGVFLLPPSLEELERRLRARGTEDEPTTLTRLSNAKKEIGHYGIFDYVIVNDDLDQAYLLLRSIVFAEKCKRQRYASICENLLQQGAINP